MEEEAVTPRLEEETLLMQLSLKLRRQFTAFRPNWTSWTIGHRWQLCFFKEPLPVKGTKYPGLRFAWLIYEELIGILYFSQATDRTTSVQLINTVQISFEKNINHM